jgi:serine/threonine protein kinase
MAPEQITGGRLGPESDWYGLGALLYEVLTGSPPFDGRCSRCWRRSSGVTRRAPELAAVPADLDSLCLALLLRTPQDRPRGEEILARLG